MWRLESANSCCSSGVPSIGPYSLLCIIGIMTNGSKRLLVPAPNKSAPTDSLAKEGLRAHPVIGRSPPRSHSQQFMPLIEAINAIMLIIARSNCVCPFSY
jgi:hypothetical protein